MRKNLPTDISFSKNSRHDTSVWECMTPFLTHPSKHPEYHNINMLRTCNELYALSLSCAVKCGCLSVWVQTFCIYKEDTQGETNRYKCRIPHYDVVMRILRLSGGKGGDYQNCSVLHCVLKLCTARSRAVLTVLWIGFCLTGPISLCVDLFVFVFVFCVFLFYTA